MINKKLLKRLRSFPNGSYFIIFTTGQGVLQRNKIFPVDITSEGIRIGSSAVDDEFTIYLNDKCNIYTSDFIAEAVKEYTKLLEKEYF